MVTFLRVIVIVGLVGCLLTLAGCTTNYKARSITGLDIVLNEYSTEFNQYNVVRTIVDRGGVRDIMNIIDGASWSKSVVSMSRQADYVVNLEYENGVTVRYLMWISPGGDRLELVEEESNVYVQLDNKESDKLYNLLTNSTLEVRKALITE